MPLIPIAKLTSASYNPRTIAPAQLDALKRSLTSDPQFFKSRPCLVNQRTDGTLVVYAGNMRLRAARELGWTEVPCVIETIPLALEQERNLKDNNSYGEYIEDQLARMVAQLHQDDRDVSLLGFDERTVSELLTEAALATEATDPDAVPSFTTNNITQSSRVRPTSSGEGMNVDGPRRKAKCYSPASRVSGMSIARMAGTS